MEYKVISHSIDETIELASNFESEKFPNMVICLYGELGSGKTLFTKGFAKALEVTETITSPTFNIIKEYNSGELPLYHLDVYRLDSTDESIGFNDYFNNGGVTIIEWADIIEDKLPSERLNIKFKVIDEDTRKIIIEPFGEKYESLCEAVL